MHSTLPSDSPIVQSLLSRNRSFAKGFHPQPSLTESTAGSADATPASSGHPTRICIITCCDPRVVPEFIFGLSLGEAIVLRTAGGSLEPALGGLLAIDTLVGLTDVVVMRHTDCGTAKWTDEAVRRALKERSGGKGMVGRRGERVQDMGFGESVGDRGDEGLLNEDVQWLKASPLVRDEVKRRLVGMLYVVETGEVKVVC